MRKYKIFFFYSRRTLKVKKLGLKKNNSNIVRNDEKYCDKKNSSNMLEKTNNGFIWSRKDYNQLTL